MSRRRFEVSLTPGTHVDFKALCAASITSSSTPNTDAVDVPKLPEIQGVDRHNIIETLERKYGSTGTRLMTKGIEEHEDSEDENYYDLEDGFVDDTELIRSIEDAHSGSKFETTIEGFFVHTGDHIQTVKRTHLENGAEVKDDDEEEMEMETRPSKKKKSTVEVTSSRKRFLLDWGEEGKTWTVNSNVEQAITQLKMESEECKIV